MGWGVCYGSGAYSAPSPGVSESCRWSGELVFGMGNSHSGVGVFFLVWAIALGVGNLLQEWGVFDDATLVWAIVVPVWGVCLWCGKFALWSGASLFDVGNCDRSGAFVTGVGNLSWSPSAVLRETRTRHLGRSRQPASRWTIFAEFLVWGICYR